MTIPARSHRHSVVVGAHVLLLDDHGRVLLARRTNTGYCDGMLHASAAGHLEAGESVRSAAVRESAEELGILIEASDLEFAHMVDSSEQEGRLQIFFVCRTWSGMPRLAEPDKHTELVWVPAHDLPHDVVPYCAQAVRAYLDGHAFSTHGGPGVDGQASASVALGCAGVPGSLPAVLEAIAAERRAQERLYGAQDLPDDTSPVFQAEVDRARWKLQIAADNHELTYRHLFAEEVAEAFAETDPDRIERELIQAAAVAVQWIQALHRRADGSGENAHP